jgi:hypothetical protein
MLNYSLNGKNPLDMIRVGEFMFTANDDGSITQVTSVGVATSVTLAGFTGFKPRLATDGTNLFAIDTEVWNASLAAMINAASLGEPDYFDLSAYGVNSYDIHFFNGFVWIATGVVVCKFDTSMNFIRSYDYPTIAGGVAYPRFDRLSDDGTNIVFHGGHVGENGYSQATIGIIDPSDNVSGVIILPNQAQNTSGMICVNGKAWILLDNPGGDIWITDTTLGTHTVVDGYTGGVEDSRMTKDSNYVYCPDSDGRVLLYNYDGTFNSYIMLQPVSYGEVSVQIDSSGNIWVANNDTQSITNINGVAPPTQPTAKPALNLIGINCIEHESGRFAKAGASLNQISEG